MVTVRTRVEDARAWATFIRALRADIARAKRAGDLDPELGAPEALHGTLLEVLAAIDALPGEGSAELRLSPVARLRVFFHYALAVHDWAERLHADGVLRVARDPVADRFLAAIDDAVHGPAAAW
jgi:hypothetical protein